MAKHSISDKTHPRILPPNIFMPSIFHGCCLFLSLYWPGQPPCGAVPSPQLPGALGSGGGICGHLSLWSHPVAALPVCPSPPPATSSLSLSYYHWVHAPSLLLLRVPLSSGWPSWVGCQHDCLSPDTFFLNVSLACRKYTSFCLAKLCYAGTCTACSLHCHSKVDCYSIYLVLHHSIPLD